MIYRKWSLLTGPATVVGALQPPFLPLISSSNRIPLLNLPKRSKAHLNIVNKVDDVKR
ncbi:hypothetical protein HanRHA438_Chr13g0629721 [Helianthus annuus]|nr:hypothetical protein HanRHA438_Chr13g0629721 [Helianthus annuus]